MSGAEGTVEIVLNGEPRRVPAGTTVAELLATMELGAHPVAVELNREVVPRRRHAEVRLTDGDRVEVVHFVGGG